jgi:hypothetical protein
LSLEEKRKEKERLLEQNPEKYQKERKKWAGGKSLKTTVRRSSWEAGGKPGNEMLI